MTICRIGATRVSIHPGILFILFGALVLGMLGKLLQAFLALVMHEAFHTVAAYALGYRIESVELLPYGGVARLEGQTASPRVEFLIAMAGPLCNFIVAGAITMAMRMEPALQETLQYFLSMNLALAFFNLLPALPLDGGRMLRAILLRSIRVRTATLLTAWIGIVCGACVLGLSIYLIMQSALNPFMLIMGLFLILGALRELRGMPEAQLSAMLRRKDALYRGEALPARTVAVQSDTTAASALRLFSPLQYTILLVLDHELRIIGQLDESRLINGIAKYGRDVAIKNLLS